MTLGPIIQSYVPATSGSAKKIVGDWVTVHAAADTADNETNTIVNPVVSSDAETNFVLDMQGNVATVLLRLAYDPDDTPSVSPVVQVFGYDKKGNHMALANRNGDYEITLATGASDETDGDLKYTRAATLNELVDALACDRISVHVKTAYDGSGGDTELAVIQARLLNGN
jgi:hypothetical protein